MLDETRGHQSCSYVACPYSLCSLAHPSSSRTAARMAVPVPLQARRRPVRARAPLGQPLLVNPVQARPRVVQQRPWRGAGARASLVAARADRLPLLAVRRAALARAALARAARRSRAAATRVRVQRARRAAAVGARQV